MDRIKVATSLKPELFKNFKILAAEQNKKVNELLEEAMQDLLEKYDNRK